MLSLMKLNIDILLYITLSSNYISTFNSKMVSPSFSVAICGNKGSGKTAWIKREVIYRYFIIGIWSLLIIITVHWRI